MSIHWKHCCTLLIAGLVLSGCGAVRDELGLNKEAPDEFQVVHQAPLSLPPDYNLRPPEPGAPRPQEGTPSDQARQTVFRLEGSTQPASPGSVTGGEQALLSRANAQQADPNIRSVVNQETAEINEDNESFADDLIFWRTPEPPGTVLDADAEEQRIRENSALGRDPDAGATPTIEREGDSAIFEGIF